VPNCKSFLVTEAKRKHVIPPLQGKLPKEIHAILTETLGEHATIKNWVAQFKRGDFCTCDEPSPG